MSIKASASHEIQPLVQALRGPSAMEREAALARLTVIGARGVPHLVELLDDREAPPDAHAAALAILETIEDARALKAALAHVADPYPPAAAAAVAVARRWLGTDAGTMALDRLAAVALDRSRPASVRLSALAALTDLPAATRAPIWDALAEDADPQVRALVRGGAPAQDAAPAADAVPPLDTPLALRRWLDVYGAAAPLPTLHRLIASMRDREAAETSTPRRLAWIGTRGQAHQVLADRGSTVALYDLRETMETARDALAPAFLHAAERIGDATLLEPLARLYVDLPGEAWWRTRVAAAAREILARERGVVRRTMLRKIEAKWPAAATAFKPRKDTKDTIPGKGHEGNHT